MKFTEHLSAHITPEWRKQYINYEVRKQLFHNIFTYLSQMFNSAFSAATGNESYAVCCSRTSTIS